MITSYYQQQLAYLRDLGTLLAKKHPALVPMLAGQSGDPDVERLLEGTAFLSGLVQERLDDNFPEIIHSLTELIFPHYLRPLPAAAIVRFTPKPSLQEPLLVPAGTELAAREIDGVQAKFTTCDELNLLPLRIQRLETSERAIHIDLQLSGMSWQQLAQPRLRFYLSDEYHQAADRLALLNQSLCWVHVVNGDQRITLPACEAFDGLVMQDQVPLYPYPAQAFSACQSLQEYFQLPQKFLFFDLLGWPSNRLTGEQLTLVLELASNSMPLSKHWKLELFCVPVVNLFSHHAETILVDHTSSEYRINPSGGADYQVYAVDRVVGFQQGSMQERIYQPFTLVNPQVAATPVYSVRRRAAKLDHGTEAYLSVAYPEPSLALSQETLVIQVRCTNTMELAQQLRYGDIGVATDSSPVMADFSNITTLSPPVTAPLGGNLLWRLLSHLYVNQRSLADQSALVALLKLYLFPDTSDRSGLLANTKRVEAIRDLFVDSSHKRLYRGALIRGTAIRIRLDPEGFPCLGDRFLFCAVLDRLLSAYSTINSYTQVTIETTDDHWSFTWPARAGKRHLL
ncbi:MAG: type VI secretion system baseplate subunit TssF [Candidatus Symbiodolus clandestinus]